ncbi:hypothetical protein GLOTRDRAFT_125088 [Gloeophyllum trabeum ATCC 11539]|uniref:Uncharacterized protein n=1 Tax=Gloeophyllum trabeum (strain ATCC 11539 / FP-39264 / Madison 617) TaxID=670483 RepID=S7QP71_GLOTA|nr:uncharacterized protein GLOTRDRAFT_125088 [Gloeophyllum trabeum ATCC 11539]EPQ61371.1 hypothetical protein GLOTRDRAFT_125088 [Gloeophyllum trabeum ATCC 11539]
MSSYSYSIILEPRFSPTLYTELPKWRRKFPALNLRYEDLDNEFICSSLEKLGQTSDLGKRTAIISAIKQRQLLIEKHCIELELWGRLETMGMNDAEIEAMAEEELKERLKERSKPRPWEVEEQTEDELDESNKDDEETVQGMVVEESGEERDEGEVVKETIPPKPHGEEYEKLLNDILEQAVVYPGFDPARIDEPWPYSFVDGETVWISTTVRRRSEERAVVRWRPGTVVGSAYVGNHSGEDSPVTYLVEYHVEEPRRRFRVKQWFCPLEGTIKPDTAHIRLLLKAQTKYSLV